MNEYLFTARDDRDHEIVDRIQARSAEEAERALRERGLSHIALQNDDVMPVGIADPQKREKINREVSPELMLKFKESSPGQVLWLSILNSYRKLGVFLVISLAYFAMRRMQKSPWQLADWLLLAVLLLPPAIAWVLHRSGRIYYQLQIAGLEARYDDMLKLVAAAERALSRIGPAGELDAAAHRAKALAGLGRMDEALAAMEPFRNRAGIGPGTFHVRLASVYYVAQDHDACLRCYEEACRLGPDEPASWMSLAECLAIRFERPAEARAALERCKSFTLSQQSRTGVRWIEASIAVAEGRFADARPALEKFHEEMGRAALATPIAAGVRHICEALLVCACAGQGDVKSARRYLDACAAFLRLHRDRLVEGAERALRAASARSDRVAAGVPSGPVT